MENKYTYKYLDFKDDGTFVINEKTIKIHIPEYCKEKKLGVMIVGLGGNNGTTLTSTLLAYNKNISWENKNGEHTIKWYGSISQYGSVNLGYDNQGEDCFKINKKYGVSEETRRYYYRRMGYLRR